MPRCAVMLKDILEMVFFFFFFSSCINVSTTYAQQGFLSIDCGTTQKTYTDDITNLTWVDDASYISTGSNSETLNTIDSTADNYKQLRDFRYFPENLTKHCYELPSRSNISYLIRAMFYFGEVTSGTFPLPIEFDVYINATLWFTYNISEVIIETQVQEGIFYSPGRVIYFCLRKVTGVPFISSLELRPLDPDGIMYSYPNSDEKYLSTLIRYTLGYGAANATLALRYPDDAFDRFWYSDRSDFEQWNPWGPVNTTGPDTAAGADMNYVPSKVMRDPVCSNISSCFTNFSIDGYFNSFGSDFNSFGSEDIPLGPGYGIIYFQDLNSSDSGEVKTVNVSLDQGPWSSPFTVRNGTSKQVYPNLIVSGTDYPFSFESSSLSAFCTMGIAVELYQQNLFDFTVTETFEGNVMRALKTSLNMSSWQGDPCVPVPFDGLTCESGSSTDGFVVGSLTLSNVNASGFLVLNNPSTFGTRGGFLSWVTVLTLTNSDMDDFTFQFLMNNVSTGCMILDLSHNEIRTIPSAIDWATNKNRLGILDMSNNALEGELSFPFNSMHTLIELNLSYNHISSLAINATNLMVLDLSHNNISQISSVDALVQNSSGSLHQLNVSNNDLTGTFSSPLYFLNSNLSMVNFDQNQIQGTLDLTTWHQLLVKLLVKSNTTVNDQLFSFVNNNITNINPNSETLAPTIDTLLKSIPGFNKTGILLGGNPYCKSAKTQAQLFLCRFTIDDLYNPGIPTKKNKFILIGTLCGGIVALLVCCAMGIIIRNLRKQVQSLQKIQQALTDQKVHPPLFPYNDLKSATRDFHQANKLGQGAFGIVYKGVLADGTIIAVKKLFKSQVEGEQVLSEFLNEVVLITGIKHRHLIQLKGCCIDNNERILVYDYAENGNLAEALFGKKEHKKMLDWSQRFIICVGIARGLSYLHEEIQPRIIHRDIKPANILLDKSSNPKIADFGLARRFLDEQSHAEYTHVAGTMGYWAPEYVFEGHLTDKADVFSFGTLALEIVSGRKSIDHEGLPLRQWAKQLHQDGKLLELLQPELRENCVEAEVMKVLNVALICVQPDPKMRATMSQVVTMLFGSTDMAPLSSNESNYHEWSDFDFLSVSHLDNSATTRLTLSVIDEKSEELPFICPEMSNSDSSTIEFTNSLTSRKRRRN